MIEQPYSGRATITDNFSGIELIIPAKKNWFVVPFLCFWLIGWTVGIVMVSKTMFSVAKSGPPLLFLIVWTTMWTLGGCAVIYYLVWSLFGKEIITVGNGLLTITKKGAMFSKPKNYDLAYISNMIAKEQPLYTQGRNNFRTMMNRGTICFEYGMKTIRFGDALDEAEARHIIELLRTKKLIQ
jgi:hypothetical protein